MEEEEPASPATRLFHSPKLQCFVIAILGSKIKFDLDVVKENAVQISANAPRFSSLLVKDEKHGTMAWIPTTSNIEDHIFCPEIDNDMINSSEEFVDDYISRITSKPMDMTKPLWELHILNIKTTSANALGIFRIHHSMGDGISLISVLLALTRKTSDPESLPTIPGKKPKRLKNSSAIRRFFYAIWVMIMVFINTLKDVALFLATTVFLKDTKSPIKGGYGVERANKRIMHRLVSLDDIKLVKTVTNATINDVVMGVTQAALSTYLNREYAAINNNQNQRATKKTGYLPKNLRMRASLIFNIRKSPGLQVVSDMMKRKSKAKWGNQIGFSLLPLKIGLSDNSLNYVHEAQAMVNQKKLSLEPRFSYAAANLMFKLFGIEVATALIYRVLYNTTLCISNVVGPQEEVSLWGHPITYIAPSVYGLPHALLIHFQSYMNKMAIVLTYDPSVIPDPHKLLDDIEDSLGDMKDAAMKRKLE